jgi:hypothetical protein
MLANGIDVDTMVEIIVGGLATATPQRTRAGREVLEVAMLRITDAGRKACPDAPRPRRSPLAPSSATGVSPSCAPNRDSTAHPHCCRLERPLRTSQVHFSYSCTCLRYTSQPSINEFELPPQVVTPFSCAQSNPA